MSQLLTFGELFLSCRRQEDQNPDFGTTYTDFGARQYSPTLRSWMTPDPMSEKYYGTSPYAFCGNNPVNFVDPDGMRIFIINNSIEYQWKEVEGIWGFYDTNDNLFSIGDGQFADMVSRHLSEIMTTNTGSSLVQDLVKHSESVFIRGGMNGYDSSKKALGFNPFVAFPVSVAFPAEHTNPRQGASEAFPYASAERATDGDWWL